jgi:glyceraldehyde-3-phosphate dehydrogenase (NAD(P))
VRRGGEPSQTARDPIDAILPDPISVPSHHGPDVQTIFPDVDIDTLGVTVPATLMHVHSVNVTLESAPSRAALSDLLSRQSRLFVVPRRLDIDGTAALKEFAADSGRPRGDLWENCLWKESIALEDNDLYLFQSIHQEANVVPENIDAIRALVGWKTAAESIALTNDRLGMTTGVGTRSQQQATPQPADD